MNEWRNEGEMYVKLLLYTMYVSEYERIVYYIFATVIIAINAIILYFCMLKCTMFYVSIIKRKSRFLLL